MRNYKGLNLTRLQILDVLDEETLSYPTIEKMIYGKKITGPCKDLFVKDLDWLVEKNYLTRHKWDLERKPLRYFLYEITEKGKEVRSSAHEGWAHVSLAKYREDDGNENDRTDRNQ